MSPRNTRVEVQKGLTIGARHRAQLLNGVGCYEGNADNPLEWVATTEGKTDRGGRPKNGLTTKAEIAGLRHHGFECRAAAYDSCDARHTFSADKAR